MDAKAINDAAAYIRSLAELRGRNRKWAEEAVREAASLSASAALKQRVIDIEAKSVEDLLAQLHGRSVIVAGKTVRLATQGLTIQEVRPDWRTELLNAIANPNVAVILMMVGIYGLIFEFMNPGFYAPGTIGAICLLTGLYALAASPVNFAGVALILLGIALLVAEIFTASFGTLGIGGTIAFVLDARLLFDTDIPYFRLSLPVIIAINRSGILVVKCWILIHMARCLVVWRDTPQRRPDRTPTRMIVDHNAQIVTTMVHGHMEPDGRRGIPGAFDDAPVAVRADNIGCGQFIQASSQGLTRKVPSASAMVICPAI
jgi:membrane-bound serine protease (ClpP class)